MESNNTTGGSVSGSTDDNENNENQNRPFYFIIVDHSDGGYVTNAGDNLVKAGGSLEITIHPDPGYYCSKFILDDRYDLSDMAEDMKSFEFMDVNDDRCVYIEFSKYSGHNRGKRSDEVVDIDKVLEEYLKRSAMIDHSIKGTKLTLKMISSESILFSTSYLGMHPLMMAPVLLMNADMN